MKDIRIGIGVSDAGGTPLETLLGQIEAAEAAGFQAVWIPNIFGADAMTVCALAGSRTARIEVATAVVPTFSRHPLYCAQQALTTQAALGGRFVLGLGPSHKIVIENMLGLSYEHPARHVREYVTVVKGLVAGGPVKFEGETYRVNGTLTVAGAAPPPILIGALGPRMRRIAGEIADGTITWMTGTRALAEEVIPGVRGAAKAAGKPAPRIVAGLPIALTRDPEGARRRAGEMFALYGQLPSYRAMLDLEGAAGPGDVALAGDERELERGIRRLADAGVTDFNAAVFAHGEDARAEVARTQAFLGELARRG
jgi:F420-dependent oxidoreductase-like protein